MDHTAREFEEDLKLIDTKIAHMGGMTETALIQAVRSLERNDTALAELTISQDDAIDRIEREIEEKVITVIARRQPVATDLRQTISAARVASDLERVGDLAKNIAKRVIAVTNEPNNKKLMIGITNMSQCAQQLLKDTLDAYLNRDTDKALKVWSRDDEIDAIYNSVFRELLTYMMEDPRNISFCAHMLFIAKNLERIGDHCTNIAENTYYLVHGRMLEDVRPKSDTTSFGLLGTSDG
jgi:phosphate transport system protein